MSIIVNEKNKQVLFSLIETRINTSRDSIIRYLDLGIHVIRLVCYTPDVIPAAEKEFGIFLKDTCDRYDSTIVIWKEASGEEFASQVLNCLDGNYKLQVRAVMLWGRVSQLFEADEGGVKPFLSMSVQDGLIECIDRKNHTAFFGYRNYEPEVFVEYGHAFIRPINALVKSENRNLTHGAVFGMDGKGILLFGRGKRGKSTLTVESMLQGFEFVSDDYQILQKKSEGLFAYPIYSMITLSHRMYNEMYNRFHGKFLCNNFSQDKYLFDISSYSEQFRTAYPIHLCLFPEIVADEHPCIVPCNQKETGRAIVQLIHSTVTQMDDTGDEATIRKLLGMVKDLPFYKFNLCGNIGENTEYLKNYLKTMCSDARMEVQLDRLLLDITYGLATILDTESARFICMNKFATNVFQMLLCGNTEEQILEQLKEYERFNPDICAEFMKFSRLLKTRFAALLEDNSYGAMKFSPDYAEKSNYRLSMREFINGSNIELIK